jgi:hypothetical protein
MLRANERDYMASISCHVTWPVQLPRHMAGTAAASHGRGHLPRHMAGVICRVTWPVSAVASHGRYQVPHYRQQTGILRNRVGGIYY